MRQWDGDMTTDSAAATIVTDARHELVKLLLQPKLGNSYELYRWAMAGVWLENVVLLKPERWLPPNYSDFDAVLADAVEKSTREESSRLSGLHWGATSSVYLQHPLFGGIPILKHWAGPGRNPQSGNGYTVKQVGRSFGPSERMTVDFSNMDASTLNVVTGQSGNIFSKHYLDQWKAWYMGTTYTLPFSQTAVQQRGVQRLELEPAR